MDLTSYLVILGVSEKTFSHVVEMADNGMHIEDISTSLTNECMSSSQIYAALVKYCQDGCGHISAQYPEIYEWYQEKLTSREGEVERGRIINNNKKTLRNTFEDLHMMEEESLHRS